MRFHKARTIPGMTLPHAHGSICELSASAPAPCLPVGCHALCWDGHKLFPLNCEPQMNFLLKLLCYGVLPWQHGSNWAIGLP